MQLTRHIQANIEFKNGRSSDMHTYQQLVQMVIRLVRAGMAPDRAVQQVSRGYSVDAQSLTEWVSNHISLE